MKLRRRTFPQLTFKRLIAVDTDKRGKVIRAANIKTE